MHVYYFPVYSVHVCYYQVNATEVGPGGRCMSGILQANSRPLLSLTVQTSGRPVLELHHPEDVGVALADPMAVARLRYCVDFDYPFTLFLRHGSPASCLLTLIRKIVIKRMCS